MAATAWFSYAVYGLAIQTFMDDQMRLVAESHAAHHRTPQLPALSEQDVMRHGALVVRLWSADGASLLASSLPGPAVPLADTVGLDTVRTGPKESDVWRVYTAPAEPASPLRVQVLQSEDYRQHRIARRALLEGLPIALLLPAALLVLWMIVWSASRSLRMVAREVAAQDERSFAELPLTRVPDEIVPLVEAFNSLLVRMREAFATQRRFVQDAAHEMRTPVMAIALQVENLRAYLPPGAAAERFALLEAGVERMRRLLEQLLRLSRQDAGVAASPPERIDVGALLRETTAQFLAQADRRGIDLGFDGRVDVFVTASATDLRSVFDNLVDNALRHTPEGSTVDLRLHEVDGRVVVDVLDNGPGIPASMIPRAFDRFFRVPGTAAGGSGLGLSIARAAAERNGLRMELLDRSDAGDGTGLMARVHMPHDGAGPQRAVRA
jgi:signal transduction histidine kinase